MMSFSAAPFDRVGFNLGLYQSPVLVAISKAGALIRALMAVVEHLNLHLLD